MSAPSIRGWSTVVVVCAAVFLVVGQILGCALTGKAEMLGTRYFEPEVPSAARPVPAAPSASDSSQPPLELQMGRVTASAYLKSRLVYRSSNVELGAYEDRQWTERPEEYLRRAATNALFTDRRLVHALSGERPTLDLELAAFEEIRKGESRIGRVSIRYALRDERSVWMTGVITVDEPARARSEAPEDVVRAISVALASASSSLGDLVVARLSEAAPKDAKTAR